MPKNDLEALQHMRERVTTMLRNSAVAEERHTKAEKDVADAAAYIAELGFDAKKPKKFEAWLADEMAEIKALIDKADDRQNKANMDLSLDIG